jgi:hypothetical protein
LSREVEECRFLESGLITDPNMLVDKPVLG